jgi:RNA polymerase sigma factor (sigma-70 family)
VKSVFGHGRFTSTHWSMVRAAGDKASPRGSQALTTLCEIYWTPIYSFARQLGKNPEEAQDLTQEFFARLLEKNTVQHADRSKGKFRSFLRTCFSNFLADEHRKGQAARRGGGKTVLSIDGDMAERQYSIEPFHDKTPEKIFEIQWAKTLLKRVREKLREESAGTIHEQRFNQLERFLPGGKGSVPYADMAADLNMNQVTLKVAVHRLRARFHRVLVDEIADTVEREDQIQEELQYLLELLEG